MCQSGDGLDRHVFRVGWEQGESCRGIIEGEVRAGLVDESRDAVG